MISLKKHIDQPADLLHCITSAYRAALVAMARAAAKPAPSLAHMLHGALTFPERKLGLEQIAELDRKVVAGLDQWGDQACEYFNQKTAEVKEILILVTNAAHTAVEQDEKYVSQLTAVSGRLNSIANLDDLTSIRQSLSESAVELKSCVEHMAEDGQQMVTRLRSELAGYQYRLEEAEKQACRDVLTGLDNRRGIERKMQDRIRQGCKFCAVLLDLNQFKQINDVHGHLAGDELLQKFSAELRGRFRPTDAVGRWGGDEFLVAFDGSLHEARSALSKATEWLYGDYRIKSAKVGVTASAGTAEWIRGETLADLLKRADEDMYLQKNARSVAG